jgi:Ca2+-transporting ATPase
LLLIGIPKYFIQAKVDDTIGTERFKKDVGSDIVKLVINAITIVVVAVPEGLPLAVTIALAYGMIKMLQDNNLVRHLAACETMGGATNICSDKTGTLTQNVMTVVTAWFGGKKFGEISDKVGREMPQNLRDALCEGISVNSTAFEATNPKGKIDFVGSKTECALLKLSQSFGYDYHPLRAKYEPYFKLYPFSSARKSMSTVIKMDNGGYRIYTKGASEIILGRCDKVMLNTGGAQAEVRELDPGLRKELLDTINEFATDALRTISLGYMDVFEERNWEEAPESGFTLLGLVGIRDPLRPEVPGAVATCQRAGITVRMVTGDNIVTAQNIAKACGILKAGGLCLEGPIFRDMPEAERRACLPRLQVLARSSPTDKQLLVGMLKEAGEVVAVTGDGTNDGPALKMADIGFSMGIAGTEVAIAASDVVLLDDNFASIVKAALWGRNIFDAIRKFIQFQLCVNVVAVVIAFIGTLSGSHGESPLTAVQLLWVNLIMDSLAALSLATEEPTPSLLERKPIGRDAHLITRKMWRFIAIHSFYQLVVNFILLYAGAEIFQHRFEAHSTEHYTIIFNTFVFMQLFNEINARRLEDEKNAFEGIHRNTFFIVILIATAAVQAIFVEFGGDFTETTHLVYWEWFICIILGAIELPIGVLVRYVPIENLESVPTASSEKFDAELEDVSHPAVAGPSTVDPLMGGGTHPKTTQEYRASAAGGQVARTPQRALKRRWSLVRMAVRQIGVLNAFKAMKTYRTMQGIDQN